MSDRSALDRLGDLYGIYNDFHDIWGNHHRVSSETKYALLSAMDYLGDGDALTALQQGETRDWRRLLAPVQVVRESEQPVRIAITVSAAMAQQRFAWTLRDEDGVKHDGELLPAQQEFWQQRDIEGQTLQRYGFALPFSLSSGYYRFALRSPNQQPAEAELSLIVTPTQCYQPLSDDKRVWGVSLQLYALRSRRNWGIGDFSDLAQAIEVLAGLGVATVGLNPLHALFPHAPDRASPYSPSSRLFLNPLYLDVEAMAHFEQCAGAKQAVSDTRFQDRLRQLRASDLVDYKAVAALKFEILDLIYRDFRRDQLVSGSACGKAFREFQDNGGAGLRRHALFEALQDQFQRCDQKVGGWLQWPVAFHDPDGPAVEDFAERHIEQIEFYEYLQWQTMLQLQRVAGKAADFGLELGLYRDLAVGSASDGADLWANQSLYAKGARIGAPADDFSPSGQDWGLPPLIPERLREAGYAPFIDILRANMRCAGALRIDHVMGLMRLFWVPPETKPTAGAYVSYPFWDLLGILALESQRNRCLVIGEDLGTVPDEARSALHDCGVFSYRLLYFEKHWDWDGRFKMPSEYPQQALVAASTHDLPTLHGFWRGDDLAQRTALDLFPSDEIRTRQFAIRDSDRRQLLMALAGQGLLSSDNDVDNVTHLSAEIVRALYIYLARTPARLLIVQMEDMLGQLQQVNLPGTSDQYPNWRYKLPLPVEHWAADSNLRECAAAINQTRR